MVLGSRITSGSLWEPYGVLGIEAGSAMQGRCPCSGFMTVVFLFDPGTNWFKMLLWLVMGCGKTTFLVITEKVFEPHRPPKW